MAKKAQRQPRTKRPAAKKETARAARKQKPVQRNSQAAQAGKRPASQPVKNQPARPAPPAKVPAGAPAGSVLLRPPRVDLPSPTLPRPQSRAVVAGAEAKVQPVTKRHYPEFRKLLLAERERLVQELTTLGERLQQVEEVGLVEASNEDDYGDVAAETFEREKGFALESSVQGMLRMVEEALRKLDAGTYGTCERCGGPIDVERLRALPFASLCIRCKAEQERETASGNGWRT
jgi:RNA polymerase-binding protein DksA